MINKKARQYYQNEEWLRKHYEDLLMSAQDIANKLDCGINPIYDNLRKFGIRRRSIAETHQAFSDEKKKIRGSKISKRLKGKRHLHTEEEKLKISLKNKGKIVSEETKKKMKKAWETGRSHRIGKYSYSWKGGISFGKYCPKFNNRTKKIVREAFNRRCYICGKNEIDNDEQLCIHHTDYNKLQGCNNKKWNLIPLCRTCHISTNTHRWFWFNLLYNHWVISYSDICMICDIEIYRTYINK